MDSERLRLLYGDRTSPNSGPNSSPRGGSPLNRTVSNPHFSPTPTSPHNVQNLPPPPGLSLPNTFNNPNGQFQFPQTPAPGFQNYCPPQNLYNPQFPQAFHNGMGQGALPPQYPFYNQSHYGHPMSHLSHHNVYASPGPGGNELELDHSMNLVLSSVPPPSTVNLNREMYNSVGYSQPQTQQSSTANNKQYVETSTVIKPMIENIVGAMSMSNGTYTHFGPTFSTAVTTSSSSPNMQRQSISQNFSMDSIVQAGQNEVPTNGGDENVFVDTSQLLQIVTRMNEVGAFPATTSPVLVNEKSLTHTPVPTQMVHQPVVSNGSESPVNVISAPVGQRSTTPKDNVNAENVSRPQTPGKPSYLEILTKNGPKGGAATTVFRKASSTSTSPSPIPYSTSSSTNGDCSNQNFSSQGANRKSGEFMTGSTSSTASSSCASASSSPITKPKLISSNSSPAFYQKGKENFGTMSGNSSGHNSKPSTCKNTPGSSPVHALGTGSVSNSGTNVQHGQKHKLSALISNEQQRKVLISSQNQHVSNGKANKTTKRPSQPNQFEFEIEDLDEDQDCNTGSNTSYGWKTAGGKGKQLQNHNNNNSIHNSTNSKKQPIQNEVWTPQNAHGFTNNAQPLQQHSCNNNNTSSTEKKPVNLASSTSSGYVSNSSSAGSLGSGGNQSGGTGGSGSAQPSRKTRDKEKPRSRKEGRNCVVRRIENLTKVWLGHLVVAVTWLWSLVSDVTTLSFSLGYAKLQDLILWWQVNAMPTCRVKFYRLKEVTVAMFKKMRWKGFGGKEKKPSDDGSFKIGAPGREENDDLLSLMGPERNITLPGNGDEALKRLHSVKGQDPYSILGVRSDCSDETIRRYYKKQAVLVHPDKNLVPGAEEAFKILARAFELVGDPVKRVEYHQKLLQAQAQEKVFGDIGNLFEQLRKKMEAASSSIRCTKCNSRHKKNRTDRPLFAARFCSQCRINHAAREGDLWAERKGLFGWSWHYFACMDNHIWEINEWAKCQKKNLQHLKADSHSVMYRLVAGAGNGNQNSQGHGGGNNEDQCSGNIDPDNDDWDSLISNLCKGPSCSSSRNGANHHHTGNGSCCGGGVGGSGTTGGGFNSATGRKRKGKRK